MGQHLVAAGQDERLAPARELEALDEARQVRRADGRTDDAAELPAHADRHDDRQDRLADDERPLRLGPLRPVQGAGLGEQRIGERQVLAPLRPHAAVVTREAHRLALDGDDDEAHGLWCRGKRAEREALPLLAVVEVDLALGHGLADIGELVAHRLEMRPQALLDHVDRDLVELARRVVEVALRGEVGDADHRHHGEEDQPDEHDRQQPRDRPALGFAGASRDVACGPFIGRGPGPASSSTIAARSVAVAAGHRGGAARQKSGDGAAHQASCQRLRRPSARYAGFRRCAMAAPNLTPRSVPKKAPSQGPQGIPQRFHVVQAGAGWQRDRAEDRERLRRRSCRPNARKRYPATIASTRLGAGRRRTAHTVVETRRSDRMSSEVHRSSRAPLWGCPLPRVRDGRAIQRRRPPR